MSNQSRLPFQDLVNVGALKRFRDRSLRNPAWLRDPDTVLTYLLSGIAPTADETWPEGSPLAGLIQNAVSKLREFRRYSHHHDRTLRSGGDPGADAKWNEILAAVDSVIANAEQLHGRRLNSRR